MERSYPHCYRSQLLIPHPFSNVTFISSYRYLPTVFCRTMLLAFSVPGEPVVVALRCLIGACPGWSRLQPLEKDLSTEDFGNSCPTPAKNKIANLLISILLSPDDCRYVLSKNFKAGWNKWSYPSKHEFKSSALTLRDTQIFFRKVDAIKLL